MDDLIITSCKGLSKHDLEPFVESLRMSGYEGQAFCICYDENAERDDYLRLCGIFVIYRALTRHLFLQRYADAVSILGDPAYKFRADRILWVDCRDLVFQLNPTEWLDEYNKSNFENYLLVAWEGINLEDCPWATDVFSKNYPREWEEHKHSASYCAGTIAGSADIVRTHLQSVYQLASSGACPDTHPSDQPAHNLLISRGETPIFTVTPIDFAATWGTLGSPSFEDKLRCLPPVVDGHLARHQDGSTYLLLHQYDRDPELKAAVRAHYKPKESPRRQLSVVDDAPTCPLVYVVTPVGPNANPEHLRACIDSVAAQRFPENNFVPVVRHMLVLDGPAPVLALHIPAIAVLLPENTGDIGSTPRTIGAAYAWGLGADAVAFLDSDCLYRPDHLAKLLAFQGHTAKPVVASGRTIVHHDWLKEGDPEAPCQEQTPTAVEPFYDTSTLLFMRGHTGQALSLSFGSLTTRQDHLIGDRILTARAIKANAVACSFAPTVRYRSAHKFHYAQFGWTPPERVELKSIAEELERLNSEAHGPQVP